MTTLFQQQLSRVQGEFAKAHGAPPTMAKAIETTLASDSANQMSSDEFLAKALTAQAAGHISGLQLAAAEQAVNAGRQPDPQVIKAVVRATPYHPFG